jgi:hypothetical protein
MPEYLNFESKLTELNDTEAKERQLRLQLERVLEALNRLEEKDRVAPSMMENVVSV